MSTTPDGLFDSAEVVEWVKIVLDNSEPYLRRQRMAERLGLLARRMRKQGQLSQLVKEVDFTSLAPQLLEIATSSEQEEPLRRAVAWTLSQLNEWPTIFNKRALDDKALENSTAIDASLAYLPPLGYADEPPKAEQVELAKEFLPHLDGRGLELRWDTRSLYIGPFFRMLSHRTDQNRKCIEYLYIWSRQVWPISGFFTFWLWPTISAIAIIPWIVGSSILAVLEIVLLSVGLIGLGLFRTLHPTEMRAFKNDTWYVPSGLILLAALYSLPWTAIIPVLSAAVFLIVRHILGPTEHVMDYAPVFLYLKNDGKRCIERARIDKFHYETTELPMAKQGLGQNIQNNTLFVETNNTWHSFQFASHHYSHSRFSYHFYVVGWVVLYAVILLMVGIRALHHYVQVWGISDIDGLSLAILTSLAFLGLILLNERAVTPISDPDRPTFADKLFYENTESYVLDKYKFVHLWNMSDEKANLVIRQKLQNPFRTWRDKSFWTTFRDPSTERLAYEALQAAEHIEDELRKKQRAP